MSRDILKPEAKISIREYFEKHVSAHPEFARHAILTKTLVKGEKGNYCILTEEYQKSSILFLVHEDLRTLPIGYTTDICRAFARPGEEIITFGRNRIIVQHGVLVRLTDAHLKHNLEVINQKGFFLLFAGYFLTLSPLSNSSEVKNEISRL